MEHRSGRTAASAQHQRHARVAARIRDDLRPGERVRFADGRPVSFDQTWPPEDIGARIAGLTGGRPLALAAVAAEDEVVRGACV